MTKQTTIGQLVADLFAKYERSYHDEELAAVATQVTIDNLMQVSHHRAAEAPRARRKAA